MQNFKLYWGWCMIRIYRACRLMLADEQMIQNVTSVQQLANMETELEQALERVRQRKVCTLNHQNSSVQIQLELASREL